MKAKRCHGNRWTAGRLYFLVAFWLVVALGASPAGAVDLADIARLNPEWAGLEYPVTLVHVMFEEDWRNGEEVARALFDAEQWYPWYEEEEGRPQHEKVTGRFYTQCLPMAQLGNVYALQSAVPKLRSYERVGPPLTEDGGIVLYAPPGPGIAFVTCDRGDVYVLVRITPRESNGSLPSPQDVASPIGGYATHPVLGDIAYTAVWLRDPQGQFDLDSWFAQLTMGDVQTAVGDRIDPGFFLEWIRLEQTVMGTQIQGELRNETGEDYMVAMFSVSLFDPLGRVVGEGMLAVQGLEDGQSTSIIGMVEVIWDGDPEELVYAVTFDFGM